MKRLFMIMFIFLSLPLYSVEKAIDPFVGCWNVAEAGYISTMTFSNGFVTWEDDNTGPRIYKYELVKDEEESFLELRYDNSSSFSLKVLKITKDEIYLSREEGRIMKLSRLY